MSIYHKYVHPPTDTHRSVAPKPIIAVAFYSTYGHIGTLADQIIKGAESTGAIVRPYFM
jgi:hypothetical protein